MSLCPSVKKRNMSLCLFVGKSPYVILSEIVILFRFRAKKTGSAEPNLC